MGQPVPGPEGGTVSVTQLGTPVYKGYRPDSDHKEMTLGQLTANVEIFLAAFSGGWLGLLAGAGSQCIGTCEREKAARLEELGITPISGMNIQKQTKSVFSSFMGGKRSKRSRSARRRCTMKKKGLRK